MSALRMIAVIALAIMSAAAPADDWSWQDGLIGDSIEGDIYADEDYPGYLCERCRDPFVYAIDFAAFAYNGYWGENPWMRSSRLGIPFRIYNSQGQWVVAWFENLLFDSFTLLPDTLDVVLRLPSGEVVSITVLEGGPDMPVGSSSGDDAPESTSCFCLWGHGEFENLTPEKTWSSTISLVGLLGSIDFDDQDGDDLPD
ncbi:MAG: hypothetical protein GTO71_11335 [Woeseiaceae bacterium]|nr:hypothetical protein [Woeseiaceae bacterium]NIP21660.1 hypothetical protein [Woeseiaceae bacterium]